MKRKTKMELALVGDVALSVIISQFLWNPIALALLIVVLLDLMFGLMKYRDEYLS